MKCENCGSENKTNARFCRECGSPIIDQSNVHHKISSLEPFGKSTISVQDSIIIGDRDSTESDDMEEARQGIELLRQLKAVKREDAAGYQEIENRAKLAETKARVMEIEAKEGGSIRKGELIAVDILRTINDLMEQIETEDVFNISLTLDILKKKITDVQSLTHIETIRKALDTLYEPFSKLKDDHKKQISSLCKYIEEAYCADLIHGDEDTAVINKEEEGDE